MPKEKEVGEEDGEGMAQVFFPEGKHALGPLS